MVKMFHHASDLSCMQQRFVSCTKLMILTLVAFHMNTCNIQQHRNTQVKLYLAVDRKLLATPSAALSR